MNVFYSQVFFTLCRVAATLILGLQITLASMPTVHLKTWEAIALSLALYLVGQFHGQIGLNLTPPVNTKNLGATPPAGPIVGGMLVATLLALASPARAQNAPSLLSVDRAQASVTLAWADTRPTGAPEASALSPALSGTYSVTSALSVAGSGEWDAVTHAITWHGGVRASLTSPNPDTRLHLALGADAVRYDMTHDPLALSAGSWSASLHAAWAAVQAHGRNAAWTVASAEWDPGQRRATYRVGLRVPVFNGGLW